MKEIWKNIPAYPGYQVSTLGRICSLRNSTKPVIMKLQMTTPAKTSPQNGPRYWQVTLVDGMGKKRHKRVHRLVLSAFVGLPPSKKHQGAHRDGNSLNNWLANLKWATQAENEADKIGHGTKKEGADHGSAKLTTKQVQEIRAVKVWTRGLVKAMALKFGVADATISKVRHNKRWTCL